MKLEELAQPVMEEEVEYGTHGPGPREILPGALYTAFEAAPLLGYRGKNRNAAANSVYQIAPAELPRVRTGPRGFKVMFLGRDLLAFIESRRSRE